MKRKIKIVVIGAGAHSKVVIDTLRFHPQFEIVGYLDDAQKLQSKKVNGLLVLGTISQLQNLVKQKKIEGAIIGIGSTNMMARDAVFKSSKKCGIKLVNAIHPTSIISKTTKIREGVFIAAGAIINPGTIINDNVVINTGSIIEHDNIIEENVYISSGVILSGRVTVKKGTFIGSGAVVIPEVTIGEDVTLGAGAVVIEDIPDNVVVVGNPAKVIKVKQSNEK
jgi:UDP-perosamine 4-acetyltransferase